MYPEILKKLAQTTARTVVASASVSGINAVQTAIGAACYNHSKEAIGEAVASGALGGFIMSLGITAPLAALYTAGLYRRLVPKCIEERSTYEYQNFTRNYAMGFLATLTWVAFNGLAGFIGHEIVAGNSISSAGAAKSSALGASIMLIVLGFCGVCWALAMGNRRSYEPIPERVSLAPVIS